jgi:YesN/AraC family two-component response regulator
MKKRILFVDDDPNVLQGLRRMFRPLRHEWDMTFIESGQEALALLAHTPCDVVVSDMRMPEMNGVQLLMAVKERYPHIIRIVLSGYAGHELLLPSVKLAHQYLSKPCDAAILQTAINRTCTLYELLSKETLQRLVAGITLLPSLPTLYQEIMEAVHSPNSSLAQIGKIIEQDLGMTAKILQLVNSAFFACHAMCRVRLRL